MEVVENDQKSGKSGFNNKNVTFFGHKMGYRNVTTVTESITKGSLFCHHWQCYWGCKSFQNKKKIKNLRR
jgi:hypothetical protein